MFVNRVVGIHKPTSSNDKVKSNRLLYAKAALKTFKYGNLAYFRVFKLVLKEYKIKKNMK